MPRRPDPRSRRTRRDAGDRTGGEHAARQVFGPRSSWTRWLDRAALTLVLLVVAMRPLITESYDSALPAIEEAAGAVQNLTPATTVWLDGLLVLGWLLAVGTALVRRRRWRWTGVEVGGLVLVPAVALSTAVASNHRIALTASIDWLMLVALVPLIANLCRDRLRVALVLIVVTASGVASAAKCGMQIGVEYRETQQLYEQNKEAFWAQQGVPLDDPAVELFERRMAAREASGFLAHANAAGIGLSLAGFAALALAGLRARARVLTGVFQLTATGLFLAILLTRSRMAVVATVTGLTLWLVMRQFHVRLRRHARATLVWVIVAVAVASLCVLVYGTIRGGLPTASLNFRWQYWTAAVDILTEHAWTGVGALNFDRHYLMVKPIDYPEEIRDPHNFLVSAGAQWGVLGAIGVIAVLTGGLYRIVRAWGRHTPEDDPPGVESHIASRRGKRWVIVLLPGFLLLRVWLFSDYWQAGLGGQAFIGFDLGFYGLLWGVAVVLLLWANNEGHTAEVDLYRMPLMAGLGAFLLQNTIDFSFFLPGTATPAAALAGVLLAGSPVQQEHQATRKRTAGVLVIACLAAAVMLAVSFLPVTRANAWLRRARSTEPTLAARAYREAALADDWDPTPWVEMATLGFDVAAPLDNRAIALIDEAIRRDPLQISLYRLKAAMLTVRNEASGEPRDLQRAIAAARRCVALYPESPDYRLLLADTLIRATGGSDAGPMREQALEHYRRALELDAARPGEREVRKWSVERREAIQQRLTALGGRGRSVSPQRSTATSPPAP